MEKARADLAAAKGAAALEPWNMPHALAGDVTKKLDPYFPFSAAVERWGRSFAALGISCTTPLRFETTPRPHHMPPLHAAMTCRTRFGALCWNHAKP